MLGSLPTADDVPLITLPSVANTAPATVEVAKVDFSKLGSLSSEDAEKILLNKELERPLTDELLVGSCLRILERPNF